MTLLRSTLIKTNYFMKILKYNPVSKFPSLNFCENSLCTLKNITLRSEPLNSKSQKFHMDTLHIFIFVKSNFLYWAMNKIFNASMWLNKDSFQRFLESDSVKCPLLATKCIKEVFLLFKNPEFLWNSKWHINNIIRHMSATCNFVTFYLSLEFHWNQL